MSFSHYPKQSNNALWAAVHPAPADKPNFLNLPRFSKVNKLRAPLAPGETLRFYCEAQNFTRFFGSIASDQQIEVVCSFSNDEVSPATGHWATDDNLKDLNYDAEALHQTFDPSKPRLSNNGKFFITIYGRFMLFEVTNVGKAPTEFLRAYLRCSVF